MELLGRLEHYVGQEGAKQLLRSATEITMRDPVCRVVYFTAGGGLGKTRLQELYPQVLEADQAKRGGPFGALRISRLVDFYEYRLLSATLIEQSLIEGLVQADGEDKWYRLTPEEAKEAFGKYSEMRDRLELVRSSGDRAALARASADLSAVFITCWNQLADRQPLVMRFDTLEVLFAQGIPTDAHTAPDSSGSSTARVLRWMEQVLPKLRHTLAIMTGRPAADEPLVAMLSRTGLLVESRQELKPFDTVEEIRDYFLEYGIKPEREDLTRVLRLTEGRPLLLACYAETRRDRLSIPPPALPRLDEEVATRAQFEEWLVDHVLNPMRIPVPIELPTSAQTTLAWCLYMLVYARRGLTREQIWLLFQELGQPMNEGVIAGIEQQSLVKVLGDRLLLHDEIFVMLDESRLVDMVGLRKPILNFLCAQSAQLVAEADSYDDLVRALADHVYYELTRDFRRGYQVYLSYLDGLISERYLNASSVLADAFWRTLNIQVQRDGEPYYPYRVMLREAEPALLEREIRSDEQLRVLKLHVANSDFALARTVSEELYQQFLADGLILPDGQTPDAERWPQDPYAYVELNLLRATIAQQSSEPGSEAKAEQLYGSVIALLNRLRAGETASARDQQTELLRQRSSQFLGIAYTRRGQARRQRQRFDEGIADAEAARRALREYMEHPVVPAPPFVDWNLANLAQVTNNLAFMLAQTGDFQRARSLSDKLLRDWAAKVSPYRRALFNNTSGLILIRAGQHLAAEQPIAAAFLAATDSQNNRAIGLVKQAQAQLDRYRNTQRRQADPAALSTFEEASRYLASERTALYDLYYEWCGAARDVGKEYARAERPDEAQAYWAQALELADRALGQLNPEPSMQRADMIERKAAILNLMGRMDDAAALLDSAEAMMGIEMPRYGRIVSAKIAYQRGYIALFRDGDFMSGFRHGATALARVYTFSDTSHDRITFEQLLGEWVVRAADGGQREELRAVCAALGDRRLFVPAGELPYQPPAEGEWEAAWARSAGYLISEITNTLDE